MIDQHPFRRAAEAKDLEQLTATLREDVVLHSPILFRGIEGREAVAALLAHVGATLENLTYVDEARGGDETGGGDSVVLRFRADVGELQLEGIDYLQLDEEGRVTELTVFMRPLSALTRFHEQMMARLGVTDAT